MTSLYLGVDTSNYTTSIGVVDSNNNIVCDKRIVLQVEYGKKGLRQQEALFQHIKNLPVLFRDMDIDKSKIVAVGVSTRPRAVEGSYMPCFLAGDSFAKTVSEALRIPLKSFSHQEGHIGSCLIHQTRREKFLTLHLSGGTTEVINCIDELSNLRLDTIGGSLDISFGQLVDRLGVKIGLGFPAGVELERIALSGERLNIAIPYKIKGGYFNLSGLENYFTRLIDKKTYKIEDIFFSLFSLFADVIRDLISDSLQKTDVKTVFIVGGVASNSIIRNCILEQSSNIEILFAEKELSSDNAVGIAYLTKIKKDWEV
jgi:N6-L-threonylcarbamoyladenine synthase